MVKTNKITRKENALVIYGGGLCDPAAFGIATFAKELNESKLFKDIFMGFYSFRALLEEALVVPFDTQLYEDAVCSYGGFFGTCRETTLTDKEYFNKAINHLKARNINWVFVGGGDGSARQVSEIAEAFHSEGINFCFFMPFTIDGINGGASVGIIPAVQVSVDIISTTSYTFLRTLEGNKYPSVIFELQGRNRDDILVEVLKRLDKKPIIGGFNRNEVEILAIPAGIESSLERIESFFTRIRNEKKSCIQGKPAIILLSEGAQISKNDIKACASKQGVKCRTFSVGHLSQINEKTDTWQKVIITKAMERIVKMISFSENIEQGKPFTVVFQNLCKDPRVEGIAYFAMLNPRQGQQTISEADKDILLKYLP